MVKPPTGDWSFDVDNADMLKIFDETSFVDHKRPSSGGESIGLLLPQRKKNCMHIVCTGLLCIHIVDECHMFSPHDPTARNHRSVQVDGGRP